MGVSLQAAQRQAVKGVDPEVMAGVEVERAGDTAAHLLGGLFCEGHGHDVTRRGTRVDEMPEPSHQGRGLAGAGAGQHQLNRMVGARGAHLRRVEGGHAFPCHRRAAQGMHPIVGTLPCAVRR